MVESNDRLKLQNDKDIEKLIPFDQGFYNSFSITFQLEPILFSEKMSKINRWNIRQERSLILTVLSIYVFRKKCIFDY
jgi:hypothetical protein